VPEIAKFYGIIVFMNYCDHDPPHFHARYGGQEVMIEILSGTVRGHMSKRALRMLFEWSESHEQQLIDNWKRVRDRRPLQQIEPLP